MPTLVGGPPATDQPAEPSRFPRLRRAYDSRHFLRFSALLICCMVALAVLIGIRGGGGPTPPRSVPQNSPPPVGTPQNPVPVPSDQDQTVPTTTPLGLSWFDFNGLQLPYSAKAGPLLTTGPVAHDYADTPLGALVAAVQIDARSTFAPNNGWREVTALQIVPGRGADQWVALRSQTGDGPPVQGWGQAAGFRFVTYSRQLAVIQLISQFPGGLQHTTLQQTTLTVVWVGGDWKLQLQPDGSDSPTAQQIPNLDGYVPWNGGSG